MSLGELEQRVLFALVRIGGEGHGAPIAEELHARTGRSLTHGALYTVLDRMEGKGLIESWIGESTPERGGRRRKVYRLLPEGARELRQSYESLRSLASGALSRLDALAEERG